MSISVSSAKVNDCVIKFANVNGTGSASANGLVAKTLFRMGLPIGLKNMFPSNIQGLPTWFEIRVNEKGHVARRGGVDIMIGMNAQSFDQDTKTIVPGGYMIYDSTRHLPDNKKRDDINYVGVPLAQLSIEKFGTSKARILLQNIAYVGVLTALTGMDFDLVKELLTEEYGKKPQLIEPNIAALTMGYEYVKTHFPKPLPFKIERRQLSDKKFLMDGNTAAALGCVYAGATVAAWYPITPSTSLADAFGKFCKKYRVDPETKKNRFAIVQAEDELAAIGMVLGATWNGARAFTATSGPGISLMSEFIGFAYYAELPAVLFNIQRVGPSTGMPTRTQQSDILSCAFASHGDTRHLLLFPANPKECFEMAINAFDLADRFQTPVFVMSDLDLGMNEWMVDPLEWSEDYKPDRGQVLSTEDLEGMYQRKEPFHRYLDKNGDGIVTRTYPGAHPKLGAFFTRGSGHDKYGRYTEDAFDYQENMDRLLRKFYTAKKYVPHAEIKITDPKKQIGVLYFGTTAAPMAEVIGMIQAKGTTLNQCRIKAFPFTDEIEDFIRTHKHVIVVEQNRDAQMLALLHMEMPSLTTKMSSVTPYSGLPPSAVDLTERILKVLA